MNVDKLQKQFLEKGYVEIKVRNRQIDKTDVVIGYENAVIELKKSIGVFSELTFDYEDETLINYLFLYDETKVDITFVKRLSDFVETIADGKSNFSDRDHIYFRGHSRTNYKLEPSIYREDNINILANEDKLYRDLLSSKPHFFQDCETTLEKLVKMQHNGIPTRLLDLTDNPLIALYFACGKRNENNGEVLVFNIDENKFKYFDSDTVAVISNLTKCKFDFDITSLERPYHTPDWTIIRSKLIGSANASQIHDSYYKEKVEKFNDYTSISELVHFIREDKPYFLNRIDPKHLQNYTVVVKAKMSIDRMVSQSGAFVLFGIDNKKSVKSNFAINKDGYKQKVIIIPSEFKSKIKEELKMLNINDATVFGDLDTIAIYFSDKYK